MKIKLNGKFTKEELQKLLKEFDKPKYELKNNNEYNIDYRLNFLKNGQHLTTATFDKTYKHSYKLYQFNRLVEDMIKRIGGKDNFATQEDINNNKIELYGVSLDFIWNSYGISIYQTMGYRMESNCFSKSKKVAQQVYDLLIEYRDYFKKAFRGE